MVGQKRARTWDGVIVVSDFARREASTEWSEPSSKEQNEGASPLTLWQVVQIVPQSAIEAPEESASFL